MQQSLQQSKPAKHEKSKQPVQQLKRFSTAVGFMEENKDSPSGQMKAAVQDSPLKMPSSFIGGGKPYRQANGDQYELNDQVYDSQLDVGASMSNIMEGGGDTTRRLGQEFSGGGRGHKSAAPNNLYLNNRDSSDVKVLVYDDSSKNDSFAKQRVPGGDSRGNGAGGGEEHYIVSNQDSRINIKMPDFSPILPVQVGKDKTAIQALHIKPYSIARGGEGGIQSLNASLLAGVGMIPPLPQMQYKKSFNEQNNNNSHNSSNIIDKAAKRVNINKNQMSPKDLSFNKLYQQQQLKSNQGSDNMRQSQYSNNKRNQQSPEFVRIQQSELMSSQVEIKDAKGISQNPKNTLNDLKDENEGISSQQMDKLQPLQRHDSHMMMFIDNNKVDNQKSIQQSVKHEFNQISTRHITRKLEIVNSGQNRQKRILANVKSDQKINTDNLYTLGYYQPLSESANIIDNLGKKPSKQKPYFSVNYIKDQFKDQMDDQTYIKKVSTNQTIIIRDHIKEISSDDQQIFPFLNKQELIDFLKFSNKYQSISSLLLIGEGGESLVLKATHSGLDEIVIKIPKAAVNSNGQGGSDIETNYYNLMQETHMLKLMCTEDDQNDQNDSIIKVREEIIQLDKTGKKILKYAVILERAHFNNLKIFENNKTFSQDYVIHFIMEILSLVAQIHSKGVAICDIKTSNFLVTRDLKLKIADFGVSLKRQSQMTEYNIKGGTPANFSLIYREAYENNKTLTFDQLFQYDLFCLNNLINQLLHKPQVSNNPIQTANNTQKKGKQESSGSTFGMCCITKKSKSSTQTSQVNTNNRSQKYLFEETKAQKLINGIQDSLEGFFIEKSIVKNILGSSQKDGNDKKQVDFSAIGQNPQIILKNYDQIASDMLKTLQESLQQDFTDNKQKSILFGLAMQFIQNAKYYAAINLFQGPLMNINQIKDEIFQMQVVRNLAYCFRVTENESLAFNCAKKAYQLSKRIMKQNNLGNTLSSVNPNINNIQNSGLPNSVSQVASQTSAQNGQATNQQVFLAAAEYLTQLIQQEKDLKKIEQVVNSLLESADYLDCVKNGDNLAILKHLQTKLALKQDKEKQAIFLASEVIAFTQTSHMRFVQLQICYDLFAHFKRTQQFDLMNEYGKKMMTLHDDFSNKIQADNQRTNNVSGSNELTPQLMARDESNLLMRAQLSLYSAEAMNETTFTGQGSKQTEKSLLQGKLNKLEECVRQFRDLFDENHSCMLKTYKNIALIYLEVNDDSKMVRFYNRYLLLKWERLIRENNGDTNKTLKQFLSIAHTYRKSKKYKEAMTIANFIEYQLISHNLWYSDVNAIKCLLLKATLSNNSGTFVGRMRSVIEHFVNCVQSNFAGLPHSHSAKYVHAINCKAMFKYMDAELAQTIKQMLDSVNLSESEKMRRISYMLMMCLSKDYFQIFDVHPDSSSNLSLTFDLLHYYFNNPEKVAEMSMIQYNRAQTTQQKDANNSRMEGGGGMDSFRSVSSSLNISDFSSLLNDSMMLQSQSSIRISNMSNMNESYRSVGEGVGVNSISNPQNKGNLNHSRTQQVFSSQNQKQSALAQQDSSMSQTAREKLKKLERKVRKSGELYETLEKYYNEGLANYRYLE